MLLVTPGNRLTFIATPARLSNALLAQVGQVLPPVAAIDIEPLPFVIVIPDPCVNVDNV